MSEGWIELHRRLKKWEWFTDVNTCHLFIYLLLSANYKTTKWRGQTLLPGQLLTGRNDLSRDTGLSIQNVRTSLAKLQSTSELTITTYNKYSVITITNWKEYQSTNQQTNQQSTSELTNNQPANQPTTNQQLTTSNKETIKKDNKVIKEKNIGDFENFWTRYDKIGNKHQALKSYNKIIKEGITHETIIRGLEHYQTYCRAINQQRQYIKHGSAWLNNRCWEDEYIIPVQQKNGDKDNRIREAAIRGLTTPGGY